VKRPLLAGSLAAGLPLAVLLAVRFGPEPMSTTEVVHALLGRGPDVTVYIVRELRLPRALLSILVGGGLALSGATFQALLRNPLAEPYILGISGGAAAGAVAVLSLGLATASGWFLPLAAFGGALLAIVLAFRVAAAADRRLDVRVLLLAGVVVGAFFTAVLAFLLAVSDANEVRDAVWWMMGDLSGATWRKVVLASVYTLPAAGLLVSLSRALNVMAIGEETALYLGVPAERVKRLAFGVGSFITAAGVAVAGVIGFVGLIIPHAIRILIGSDHRWLLPLSFLAGAAFLTMADLAAQLVLAPTVIPVGVVTAFVGVPIFLVLLRRTLTG
jgi:iron complex transport system permease protein